MVQGTAKLILSASSHVWNGHSMELLTSSDRKKVADFYQRHSMTRFPLFCFPKIGNNSSYFFLNYFFIFVILLNFLLIFFQAIA